MQTSRILTMLPIIAAGCFLNFALERNSFGQGLNLDAVQIKTVPITDGVFVLMGGPAQGNILVSTGPEGFFLVDSMYAPMHDKIMTALAKLGSGPVRYVVNTHLHGDHTQGNAAMAALGATVISHDNMRSRMQPGSTYPVDTLPALTYSDSITLHFNGEEIEIFHPDPAHTDGDSIIYFHHANVMHVGDVPASVRYPNIGVDDGGTVTGMMAAGELVMQLANADTRIIPGHLGPVTGFEEIREQLAMFRVVSGRIRDMIDKGMSLEQVLAAKPTAEFDAARAAGAITAERFVTLVYTDLSRSGGAK